LGFITAQYENLAMFVENIYFSIPTRMLLALLAAEFICVIVQLHRHGDAITDDEQPELFEEHRYDLQRVKRMLASTPILGIDSSWGNGKSFVVDYLVKEQDVQEAYFVIKIEALSYQFEEFDSILIHKLDALLQENGIFSIYSEEIQEAANKSLLGRILYYFFRRGDSSRTSTFESLRTALAALPKKVLIIYEDLERVGKPDLIKRLFAISERLVGKNVQVIYEYDGRQLDEQGLERAYREKYIPLEMNLTPIRYESMVEYVWDELRMETIDRTVDIDSTKTIKGAVCHMGMVPFSGLFPKLQAMATVNIDKNALTVRRMRIFLTELKSYLAAHEKLSSNEISIVIAFYFIKHFMYEQFQCLKVGKTLE
ncbi:P-loop NTPase fold protein, partial [Megasphaera sp.]